MTAPRFTADQFTPTKWDTAEQKVKFANQYVRFVTSGFKATLFPKWFYKRLSMTFGHIAHYDQAGFFDTWFQRAFDRVAFIENALNHPCYGDPAFTYSDVERAIQSWLHETEVLHDLRGKRDNETEARELATLRRLTAKYGPQEVEP